MTSLDETGLRAVEEQRRLAMLAADTADLGRLLAEDLVYVHSSGVRDSRQSYLHKLSSGALRYETLEFTAPQLRLLGNVGLVHAGMRATVLRDGGRHTVAGITLAVWEHGAAGWKLHAVQVSPAASK